MASDKKSGRAVRGSAKKKTRSRKQVASHRKESRRAERERPAGLRSAAARASLEASDLTWRCDPSKLGFDDTSGVAPLHDIMGQDRAIRALRLGVDLFSPGYNIYVSGVSGTGKTSTVKKVLETIRPRCSGPRDFCYVYNFKNPYNPVLLTFTQGGGSLFARRMGRLVQILQKELPAAIESGSFAERKEALAESYLKRQKELFHSFEEELKKNGFILSQIRVGPVTRPEILIPIGDKAYPYEQLALLVESGQIKLAEGATLQEFAEKDDRFRKRMREVMKESRSLNAEMMEKIEGLERSAVDGLVDDFIDEIKQAHKENARIVEYLDDLKEHVLSHLDRLKAAGGEGDGPPDPFKTGEPVDPYLPYRVNVILDNSKTSACPVIMETNPTYNNVFGTIERTMTRWGQAVTDFTKIKAGSMLQADGGYLVLNALDSLSEPGLWKTLKRVLTYRELVIQGIEGLLQLSTASLKPEPIDVDVKVILIGPPHLYFLLHAYDEDFAKIFKIRADFDTEISLNGDAVGQYASFVAFLAGNENLKPFTCEAVARVIEYGVRRAGRRNRITSRFGEIADVIREADFWARLSEEEKVGVDSVRKALHARRDRISLLEEKVRDRLKEKIILIDTDGSRVGQVNGLAVFAHGEHRFGVPTRITAAVGVGKAGIINVEREAKLSGNTHDKGVLILSGYLREEFAREIPLSLSASICFEQSYGGVDGDSASSTELYAILSALAEVPLRQDLAVTGSINQKGDIQAIGGVNEKIEGFFHTCRERGLTGEQGVLIPEANVQDLMLAEDVRDAVAEKRFHVYPIRRVEEGIEILTGLDAGARGKDGKRPAGTLYEKVEKRLVDLQKKSIEKATGKKAARAGKRKPRGV
jgi:ATP-dependent Lon protease